MPTSAQPRIALFKRPDGPIVAMFGMVILVATWGGIVTAAVMMRRLDAGTVALMLLGLAGGTALAAGMINAWRVPMLVIRHDCFTIPTFFATRDIAIGPGQRVGELLASSHLSPDRAGSIEGNKFVHFYALDDLGKPVELLALHRDAPQIPHIRRALAEVAGLPIDSLHPVRTSGRVRPDLAHWQGLQQNSRASADRNP